jgi:hypothetical protein
MFASSINMHQDTLARLSYAAVKLNTSRREVIVRLLMRVMRDIDAFRRGPGTVCYQPDDREGRWHCFAVKFKTDENEFFADLRKLCKCSVSFLVAIAVEKYLDDMLEENRKGIYDYTGFSGYQILKELSCGILCWRHYWGNPGKTTPLLKE